MNRRSVVATLNSHCANSFVKALKPNAETGEFVDIFKRPYDSHIMGIDNNGFWCIADDERMWTPEKLDQFYVFYCLLYTELQEVVLLIKQGLQEKGLPLQIAYTFPFDELVFSAMKASSHWRDLSMKWIEQGYPLTDEMRFYLCGKDAQSKGWLNWKKQRLNKVLGI